MAPIDVRFWEQMAQFQWNLVAREMVAALRGKRSRAQLSRRLGYRTNTVSDWEAGRRFPATGEFLRVCRLQGIDVIAAFQQFHTATADELVRGQDFTLAAWLNALRGGMSIAAIATRAGLSRYAVSRILHDRSRPRLPEFLQLVDSISGRASDLVGCLLGIERLPTLREQFARRRAAKRLAFEYPESEAVLRVMETTAYRSLAGHRANLLAEALGLDAAREQEVLSALERAGILERHEGRYRHVQPLNVDTSAEPAMLNRVKAHWATVAAERLKAPRQQDWLGYNVMSVSEADLERVREILRNAYREIRAVAVASEPVERAALLNLQLVTFEI